MDFENNKTLKSLRIQKIRAPWSLTRWLQAVLALFCFGYFYEQPSEWITLIMGLALSVQAVFNVQLGCAAGACSNEK